MNTTFVLLATLAGVTIGGIFAFLRIPVPAPHSFAGVMGIVGIWLGYRIVDHVGLGFDVVETLGL